MGMGVDNVIVELDNLELPILDGSAKPYVEAFLAAGIKVQRRRREYYPRAAAGRGARGREVYRRLSGIGIQHSLHDRFPCTRSADR